jgi:K+-transporting ATPase KdpF subunit
VDEAVSERIAVNAGELIAGLIALALLVYLTYALLWPERF